MKSKKLFTKRWDYTLFQVDDKKAIAVVFFDVVDYSRSFFLDQDFDESQYDSLAPLSEEIRTHPSHYEPLEIKPSIL